MPSAAAQPVTYPVHRTLFDPPPELGEYRRSEPIRPLRYPDGETGWLVTSYEHVREVLGDARFTMTKPARIVGESFLVPLDGDRIREQLTEVMRPMRAGTFINMDAPEHTRFRRSLGGRFSAKYVAGLGEVIERIVAERLDLMAAAPRPFEFVSGFAVPVALQTICHVLGIPVRDEWNSISVLMEVDPPLDEDVLAQYRGFRDVMAEEVRRLGEAPNDGVLSMLLHEGGMSEEEVVGVGQFLVVAGHHTTSNMMSVGSLVLQRDRRHWDGVVDDPSALPATIEELIRYITVLQLAPFTRTATEDVEIGGVVIRAGERVQVSAPAANRDPSFLERPDEFDPTRDVAGHMAFGYGIHQCLGQHLARLELNIVFTRMVERFPDLRPAVPLEELEVYPGTYPGHGIHRLPVTWGSVEQGASA